ncbi:hypothetical protein TIFTF001_011988 [Ficus carica]|uniref:Uncharacterized protein n=1 Tax=Ficus carica TaxID=3494 RepID=A0AA88ABH7_FICCA|nr:hypothetical protein TIFTF001_011988 [Ficus carica]
MRLMESAPRRSSMAPPSCFCDRPSKLMTAWIDANPGHRFYVSRLKLEWVFDSKI